MRDPAKCYVCQLHDDNGGARCKSCQQVREQMEELIADAILNKGMDPAAIECWGYDMSAHYAQMKLRREGRAG